MVHVPRRAREKREARLLKACVATTARGIMLRRVLPSGVATRNSRMEQCPSRQITWALAGMANPSWRGWVRKGPQTTVSSTARGEVGRRKLGAVASLACPAARVLGCHEFTCAACCPDVDKIVTRRRATTRRPPKCWRSKPAFLRSRPRPLPPRWRSCSTPRTLRRRATCCWYSLKSPSTNRSRSGHTPRRYAPPLLKERGQAKRVLNIAEIFFRTGSSR